MWFTSVLGLWRSWACRTRRPRRRPAAHFGPRPTLRQLEDRTLLTGYTAANASDLINDINAANTAGGFNTISLTAPTTSPYDLTAVDNRADGPTGLPVIAARDHLTIVGNGDTIERNATLAFRLLDVATGASLKLIDLTLQYGQVTTAGTPAEGAAVYNLGRLTLKGVTVYDNFAENTGTQSFAAGGGIYSAGTLTLEAGTKVESSHAIGPTAYGGGIYSAGRLMLAGGVKVEGNAASGTTAYGGGLYVAGGTATVRGGAISANTAGGYQAYGGGLYMVSGKLTVTNTKVATNLAGGRSQAYGGGLYVASGTAAVSNAKVSHNAAQGSLNAYGGGLYVAGGTLQLTGSTVSSNTAVGGNGGSGNEGRTARTAASSAR
jgi:hypothetical protein